MQYRMQKDSAFAHEYTKFRDAYERLGHMRRIPPDKLRLETNPNYIPHHAICRDSDGLNK